MLIKTYYSDLYTPMTYQKLVTPDKTSLSLPSTGG